MSRAELRISVEMLRELIDLPDSIRINGFGNDWLALASPVPPHTLTIAVESDYEFHAETIDPLYRADYEQGIKRVALIEINGYQGPIAARPSMRRKA